jgi:hypothetical protein
LLKAKIAFQKLEFFYATRKKSKAEDDFDHPKLPIDHPLRRHVLYRIERNEWKKLRDL